MGIRKVEQQRIVMEEKSVAECDTCGTTADMEFEDYQRYPEPWVIAMTAKAWRLESGHTPLTFCSWKCLTQYAKNQVDQ